MRADAPWAMVAATAGVIWVLYRREFRSEVLLALEYGLEKLNSLDLDLPWRQR